MENMVGDWLPVEAQVLLIVPQFSSVRSSATRAHKRTGSRIFSEWKSFMNDVFVLSLFCFTFSLENSDFTGILLIARSVTLLNKLQLCFIWVSNSPCDASPDKNDWDFFAQFFYFIIFSFFGIVFLPVFFIFGSVILIPVYFKFWALQFFFFYKGVKTVSCIWKDVLFLFVCRFFFSHLIEV